MEAEHFSKHNSAINIRAPVDIFIHIHPMYLEALETFVTSFVICSSLLVEEGNGHFQKTVVPMQDLSHFHHLGYLPC